MWQMVTCFRVGIKTRRGCHNTSVDKFWVLDTKPLPRVPIQISWTVQTRPSPQARRPRSRRVFKSFVWCKHLLWQKARWGLRIWPAETSASDEAVECEARRVMQQDLDERGRRSSEAGGQAVPLRLQKVFKLE